MVEYHTTQDQKQSISSLYYIYFKAYEKSLDWNQNKRIENNPTKGRQQSTKNPNQLWLTWSKKRQNNHTQSVKWITNISIRRTLNCTKAKHKGKSSKNKSLSSKEALWRTVAHKLSQKNVHQQSNSIVQHSEKVMKVKKKRSLQSRVQKNLSRTLHDHVTYREYCCRMPIRENENWSMLLRPRLRRKN